MAEVGDRTLKPNRALEYIIDHFSAVKNYIVSGQSGKWQAGQQANDSNANLLPESQCTITDTQSVITTPHSMVTPPKSKCAQSALTSSSSTSSCSTNQQVHCSQPSELPSEEPVVHSTATATGQVEAAPPEAGPSSSSVSRNTKVLCPVCQLEFKQSSINTHLDTCLRNKATSLSPVRVARKPMPKLVYNLLKDKDLRDRLKKLGLSHHGDKMTLANRHRRFTCLYNSECDAPNPRSMAELIAQLESEEAGQKKKLPEDKKVKQEDDIEVRNSKYLQQNKDHYHKLIEEIRNRTPAKPLVQKTDDDPDVEIIPTPKKLPVIVEEISLLDDDDDGSIGTSQGACQMSQKLVSHSSPNKVPWQRNLLTPPVSSLKKKLRLEDSDSEEEHEHEDRRMVSIRRRI